LICSLALWEVKEIAPPRHLRNAVIAGLDRAIPIMRHGRASLSGTAGSSPAMMTTIPCKSDRL
jgi:hypothetical protein